MPSLDSLREEIHDVFMIFDEDGSGSISIPELTRALYTITGGRPSRGAILKLIAAARESIGRDEQEERHRQQRQQEEAAAALEAAAAEARSKEIKEDSNGDAGGGGSNASVSGSEQHPSPSSSTLVAAAAAAVVVVSSPNSNERQKHRQHDNSDGVDALLFERVVMRVMNSRSPEEELVFAFGLLEDGYYPGFITKESLKRAAAETDEPLTDAEIAEMFDSLVTGIPSAAVDFSTFTSIQAAARRLEDA